MRDTKLRATLSATPALWNAFWRLDALDANGACLVATDILDALEDDNFDAIKMAAEIHQVCEQILAID
jgi:hypothetical protein